MPIANKKIIFQIGRRNAAMLAAALGMMLALPLPAAAATAWQAQASWNAPFKATYAGPTLGDLDGDGDLDLLVGGFGGNVYALKNIGTTSAPVWSTTTGGGANDTPASWSISAAVSAYAKPVLVDLDGDGDLDLLVGGQNTVLAYRNTGSTTNPVWTRNAAWDVTGLPTGRFYRPAAADLNGDGLKDLMLGVNAGNALGYINTGTPTAPSWAPMPAWDTIVVSNRVSAALADIDGDGDADLLLGGLYGTVFAFQNTGSASSPVWTSIGDWFVPDRNGTTNYAAPALGDLDGDSDLDLLYGDADGVSYAYKNTGLPTAPSSGTGPPTPIPTSTVTETFDSFACTGGWKPAAGPNTSYLRSCGDGWYAYAQDVNNSSLASPLAGPVGDQNVVTYDAVNGPSAPTGTLGAGEIYTAASDSVRGVLWLLKTFPVVPGQPIQGIQADYRIKTSSSTNQYVGMVVFDGTVTNPSGQTVSGVPARSDVLASNVVFENCGSNTWCPWHTASLGGSAVTPTKATITVALRVGDTSVLQNSFAELDNVIIDGVADFAAAPVPATDVAQVWSASFEAGGASGNNKAEGTDVAVDALGDTYVTGRSYNDSNYDIVTVMYDSTGAQTYLDSYDGGDADIPVSVTLDGAGNVYVLARSFTTSFDYIVIKYDSGLNRVWASPATYDNAGADDEPSALAVDGSGNVYVTGTSCAGVSCQYATVKFNSSGGLVWSMTYGGAGYDQAVDLALDGSNNVYVTGITSGGVSDDITTLKYDSAGTLVGGPTTFTGRTNDRAVGIEVDASGNAYVVGWNWNSSSPDILLIKYNSSLSNPPLWSKQYDSGQADLPVAMTLDSSGNIYITGTTGSTNDHNFVTLKYLPDGTNAWLGTFGASGSDDKAVDIAVDASGNVFVAGTMSRSVGNTDFGMVKYSPSGIALSSITFDGYELKDTAAAIALGVDTQGDPVPVVTGYSATSGGIDIMTTVKYQTVAPDLTMTQFSGPSSATVGVPIDITNTVLNIDDLANKIYADSGPFSVGFFVAPDVGGAPNLLDLTQIGSRAITNLSPGQSSTDVTSVTIPSSVLEGDYFLVGIADPDGVVSEKDETNNRVVAGAPITVQGTQPDLAVTGLSGPSSAARGDTVSVSTTVTNLVSISAGSFRVGIYLSDDTDITTSDTLIGSFTVAGGLAGFASDSRSTDVTIPTSLSAGSYYLGVIADDQGDVAEANEDNNSELLRTGTSNSTQLVTDTDFLPGLPGTNVQVVGTGLAARVTLSQSVGWTAMSSWDVPTVGSSQRAKPALIDMDGDGDLDALVGSNSGTIYGFENIGTASSPQWSTTSNPAWNLSTGETFVNPTVGDLDGDGVKDLLVGTRSTVIGFKRGTSPVWTRMGSWDVSGLSSNRFWAPALVDLNGDNKRDLLLGSVLGTVVAYENTGTTSAPAWTANSAWDLPDDLGSYSDPTVGDLDGDGLKDLMIGESTGTMKAYLNTGNSTVPAWTAEPTYDVADINGSTNYASPALGDLDADGAIDLLYGDITGVSYGFRNNGAYASPGTYTSPVVDAGTHGGYTTLVYVSTEPTGTSLSVEMRTGNVAVPDGSWTAWVGGLVDGSDISAFGTDQYVQYRVTLTSSVASKTPALYSIEARTQSAPPQPTVLSLLAGPGGGSGGGGLGVWDVMVLGLAGLLARVIRTRRTRRI